MYACFLAVIFFNDWILNFVQFPIGFLFFAIFKFSFLFVLVLMSVLDNGSDHVNVDKIREPNVLSFPFPISSFRGGCRSIFFWVQIFISGIVENICMCYRCGFG